MIWRSGFPNWDPQWPTTSDAFNQHFITRARVVENAQRIGREAPDILEGHLASFTHLRVRTCDLRSRTLTPYCSETRLRP
jgi:hypothetical protein